MISGVRASSIRMLSTSSTIAKGWPRLDAVLERVGHVVAQVVEAELGVGAVDDVAGVLALPGGVVVALLDRGDADAEHVVDGLHPFGVAAGEVVVDGDEVDAVAGQRVEEDGKRRGQGLALARLHLGDRALVQDHATDQLHVVVALADRAAGGLAGQGKGLGQQIVERLAVGRALAQIVGLLAQLGIVEQLHLRLDPVDRLGALLVPLELAPLADAQRARDHVPCSRHCSRVARVVGAGREVVGRPSDVGWGGRDGGSASAGIRSHARCARLATIEERGFAAPRSTSAAAASRTFPQRHSRHPLDAHRTSEASARSVSRRPASPKLVGSVTASGSSVRPAMAW